MSIWGKMKFFLGCIRHPRRFLYPYTYSSKRYIEFLKSKGCSIGEKTRFISPSQCHVDPGRMDYISIGNNCCLVCSTILAHDYSWYTFLGAFNDVVPDPGGKVVIGNNVFVGYKSVILKDTKIGDNVIIGAQSVVKGIVPSNTVWAGVPAKQICRLEEFYEKKVSMKLESAIMRRDFIKEKKGRNPSIEEMGLFALLFLERTEDNWKSFLCNIEFNGIRNNENLRNYFFSSVPVFESFDVFLKV